MRQVDSEGAFFGLLVLLECVGQDDHAGESFGLSRSLRRGLSWQNRGTRDLVLSRLCFLLTVPACRRGSIILPNGCGTRAVLFLLQRTRPLKRLYG